MRFCWRRCRKCENQFHPQVYTCPNHPGLQVRRVRGSTKSRDSGWEAVILHSDPDGLVVKVSVLVLGRVTREAVAEALYAATNRVYGV